METISNALTQLLHFYEEHPFIPGTISFGVTWMACSITQDYMERGKALANTDWLRALRFCLFGAFFMAPIYYLWLKITFPFFKEANLSNAIGRAALEQVTVGPFSLICFFFIMCLLEKQPLEICVNEVREKFWPTYVAGSVYWPTMEIANYYFVSEQFRLMYVSVFNFIWVLFLAHKEAEKQKNDMLEASDDASFYS